jgi:hypothetical protein
VRPAQAEKSGSETVPIPPGGLSASELLSLFMADLGTLDTEKLAKWFDEESKLWLPPASRRAEHAKSWPSSA